MDVLSEIFSAIRVSGSALAEIRCGGGWGIDMETDTIGIPFYHVTEGGCWLLHGPEATRLSEGDLVVAMHWPRHALASAIDSPLETARELINSNDSVFWTGGTLQRPNILSAGTGDKDVRILAGLFSLEGRGSATLIGQLPSMLRLSAGDENLSPQLSMALEFIHHESQSTRPGYIAVAGRLMDLLFIQILRSALTQPTVPIGLLAGLADPHINRALSAIHATPDAQWTVANLAKQAGLSRTIFAERFRAMVGATPIQYVTRWRMTIAEDLLSRTDLGIEIIRTRLGYASGFVFARAFRAHSGLSPRDYRLSKK